MFQGVRRIRVFDVGAPAQRLLERPQHADASTGPYNYLEHLNFNLMLQDEARPVSPSREIKAWQAAAACRSFVDVARLHGQYTTTT